MDLIKSTLLVIIASALIISCAAIKKIVPKRETLEKRAEEYFSYKVEDDLSKMYMYINPSTRERISEKGFIRQQKRYADFDLKDFIIKEITFTDPTHAMVGVIFVMDKGNFSTQFPFVFEDDNWYRHYPTYETDIKK